MKENGSPSPLLIIHMLDADVIHIPIIIIKIIIIIKLITIIKIISITITIFLLYSLFTIDYLPNIPL